MNIAILGADLPGRNVAQRCAVAGYTVRVHADDASTVMDSIDIIERRLDDAADAGKLETETVLDALDRLEPTTDLEGAVSGVDVIFDTVTNDVGELQKRFAAVEEHASEETVIATTHPALSVTAAAAGLRHPDRALGARFHHELDELLAEVVITEQTGDSAVERLESVIETVDGTSVRVFDSPGLASDRLALALEVEAMRLVADGVASVEAVDTIMEGAYDHAMGPLEQADRAGLDQRLLALEHLVGALGDRYRPPDLLEELVSSGQTGADAGSGFYVWEAGEPTESAVEDPELGTGPELPDDPGLGT